MRFINILFVTLLSVCLYAQGNETDAELTNLGAIKIEQKFGVFRHCWFGEKKKPKLKSMVLRVNNVSYNLVDNISHFYKIENFYNEKGEPKYTLNVEVAASNMRHNNDCSYSLLTSMGNHTSQEVERRSACGIRGAHEGFRTKSIYTIDNPIIVTCLNSDKKSCLCVDDSDNSFLSLSFNAFYSNSATDAKLQFYNDKKGIWVDIKCSVVSGGSINLKYDDIVGNDYDHYLGKFLRIRAKKRLISGEYSYSKEIDNIRFYAKVPSFQVVETRRPSCDTTPLKIRIQTDNPVLFNDILNKTGCNIKISHDANYDKTESFNREAPAFYLSQITKDSNKDNVYIVEAKSTSGIVLSSYLSSNEYRPTEGLWKMQIEAGVNGNENLYAAEQTFRLPAKLDPINLKQSEYSLFEYGNPSQKYHLYSNENPYVILKDITTESESRYKYFIYENPDKIGKPQEIGSNSSTYDQLPEEEKRKIKQEFEREHPLKTEYEKYIENKVRSWYNGNVSKNPIELKTLKKGSIETKKLNLSGAFDGGRMISDGNYLVCNTKGWPAYPNTDLETRTIDIYRFNVVIKDQIENYLANGFGGTMNDNNGYAYHITSDDPRIKINYQGSDIGYYGENGMGRCEYNYHPDANTSNKYAFLNVCEKSILTSFGGKLYMFVSNSGGFHTYCLDVGDDIKNFNPNNTTISGYSSHFYPIYYSGKNVRRYDVAINADQTYKPSYTDYTTKYDVTNVKGELDGSIVYKAKNGKVYTQLKSVPNFDTFYSYFKSGLIEAVDSTFFRYEWNKYRKEQWQYYKLKKTGLHVPISSALLNKDAMLYVYDSDGCPSDGLKIRVNVLTGPKITYEITQYPDAVDAKNGKAKIHYIPGGPTTYNFNGVELTNEQDIYVENLSWGENSNIIFYSNNIEISNMPYPILISPRIELDSVSQKCSYTYGKISISGQDYDKLPNTGDCIMYYNSTSVNNKIEVSKQNSIDVKAGTYTVEVKYGGKWCLVGNITVKDEVFNASCTTTDATEIGGNGSISFKFDKKTKEVTIKSKYKKDSEDYLTLFSNVTSDYPYQINPSSYYLIAEHDGCKVSLTKDGETNIGADNNPIIIKAPTVKFKNSSIIQQADGTVDIAINVETSNINDYKLILKNGNETIDEGKKNINIIGEVKSPLSIYLDYDGKTNPLALVDDICLLEMNCSVEDASDKDRCYGEDGEITLKADEGSKYSINGSEYTEISKSGETNVKLPADLYAVNFEKSVDKVTSYGNILQTIYKTESVEIEPVEQLHVAFDVFDLTCFRSGNEQGDGVIMLNNDSVKYNKGAVTFALVSDNNAVSEYKNKFDKLDAGDYLLRIKDSGCKNYSDYKAVQVSMPDTKLQFETISKLDPSCLNNNGEIKVKVKGGWNTIDEINGSYNISLNELSSFDESTDLYIPNQEVKFEEKGYGSYVVYAVDQGDCVISNNITLEEYVNPYVTAADSVPVSCYGYSDGEIRIKGVKTHGVLNKKDVELKKLIYYKSGSNDTIEVDYTDHIKGLIEGSYGLRVIDSNGCATIVNNKTDKTYSQYVSQPDPIVLGAEKLKDVSCYEGSDGEAQLHVTGGNDWSKEIYILKKYTESSENTESTEDAEDTENTDNTDNTESTENTDNTENAENTEGAENTENTEVAEVTDLRQIGGEYNGRNAKLGEASILPGLDKGIYALQVKDLAKGCLSNIVEGVEILAPDEPISAEVEVNKALCANQTGSVTVRPKGGWGEPFKVELNGQTLGTNADRPEVTFDDMMAGAYALRITDRAGATLDTMTVVVPRPNDPINFDKSELLAEHCEADGAAHIVIDGGTGSYHTTFYGMEFDTPEIDLALLKAGDYTLEVIDSNECESNYSFTIADNRLAVGLERYYTTAENNTSVAVIEASVSGGMEPYTYEWRRVDNEPAVLRVAKHDDANATPHIYCTNDEGIYVVKISDAANCMRSEIIPLLAGGSHDMKVVELQRETSLDAHDGYAVVESDRTDFTSKRLYNAQTDEFTEVTDEFAEGRLRVSDLAGGDYALKCVLPDGRLRAAVFTIEPYIEMTIDTLDLRHASLPGKADGLLKLNVNGGIAPFTLKVTHTTDETYSHKPIVGDGPYFAIDSLVAGTYNLEVTDSTSNVAGMQFTVIEPEKLTLRYTSRIPVTCYGYSDGSVRLAARGGWGKYQFARANNGYDRSDTFRGLPSGSHRFRVIDRYGTEQTLNVYIDSPDSLEFALAEVDSVSCHGLSDGAMRFNVAGGNGDYTLRYAIGKDITKDMEFPYTKADTALAKLTSRNYQITFTDKYGCYAYDTVDVFIPQPEELRISNADITNTTCDTDNGRIQITTDGGSLPYRYSWVENGETDIASTNVDAHNNQIVNLKQDGLYQVGITDLHGCATEGTYRIDHSSKPKVSAVSTVDVTCFGLSDGIAAVDSAQVVYGYPWSPFTLTWPQGQNNTMSVNTLPTGSYYVRITDQNNCVDSTQFEVGTPQPVKNTLLATLDAHCYGYSDGRIETRTTGGVGEYSYLWDTGATTSYAENIPAGSYTVVVRDAHNCADTAEYSIGEPEELIVDLGDDALICPQGHHVFDAGEYNTYEWYKVGEPEVIEFGRYLAVGEEGDYRIVVTDRDGCFARDTVRLSIGENALVANFLMASDASLADTVMLIELSNMPLDSLKWETSTDFKEVRMPDIDTEDYLIYLKPNKTGTYNITMKAYSGGCESYETKEIEIFEAQDIENEFDITYNPLIKSVKASPNPNDGNFTLNIELREAHECSVRINSVISGQSINVRNLSGADKYAESYDISGFGNGLYVMSVEAGKERRVMKLLVKSK